MLPVRRYRPYRMTEFASMPTGNRQRPVITYDDACQVLETVLASEARRAMLDAIESAPSAPEALGRLRACMRVHKFPTGAAPVLLHRVVQALDQRTRRDGFHLLQSWDYRGHRFADEIAPVLMLDHCGAAGSGGRDAMAVLLDHYFLSLLGLLTVRAWDDGDPNVNLDRVTTLLRALAGPGGSGRRFVGDAETLLLLSISQYHPDESAYDRLIQKVWMLDERHRLNVAQPCAASLGSHLRWGLRYMYRRDVGLMRADNVVDYPWLLFACVTLARAIQREAPRNGGSSVGSGVAEALVNGLAADPWAFTATAPSALNAYQAEHAEVRDWLSSDRQALLDAFEYHRPQPSAYSPLGFQCNFLCNTLVGMVATSLADPTPRPPLDALFTARPVDGFSPDAAETHARALMAYAGGDSTRSDIAALIMYDPYEGVRAFNTLVRVLAEQATTH